MDAAGDALTTLAVTVADAAVEVLTLLVGDTERRALGEPDSNTLSVTVAVTPPVALPATDGLAVTPVLPDGS